MAAIFWVVCHTECGAESLSGFYFISLKKKKSFFEEEEESWQQGNATAATANGSLCDTRHRFTAPRFSFLKRKYFIITILSF